MTMVKTTKTIAIVLGLAGLVGCGSSKQDPPLSKETNAIQAEKIRCEVHRHGFSLKQEDLDSWDLCKLDLLSAAEKYQFEKDAFKEAISRNIFGQTPNHLALNLHFKIIGSETHYITSHFHEANKNIAPFVQDEVTNALIKLGYVKRDMKGSYIVTDNSFLDGAKTKSVKFNDEVISQYIVPMFNLSDSVEKDEITLIANPSVKECVAHNVFYKRGIHARGQLGVEILKHNNGYALFSACIIQLSDWTVLQSELINIGN